MTLEKIKTKYPRQFFLTLLLLFSIIFIMNDSFLYKEPIGKITKVKTVRRDDAVNYNNGEFQVSEKTYSQTLTVRILNTKNKGKKVKIQNTYSYSQVDSQKMNKGDKVFLNLPKNGSLKSCSIQGIKRDSYLFVLLALFIYTILITSGKRGLLVTITAGINIGIFAFALEAYSKGQDIMFLANILIIVFPLVTLLLTNGVKKSTFFALAATFSTLFLSLAIFNLSMKYGEPIDYAQLDYLVGGHDLDKIFFASIELAGLGVVMDVTASICSSLQELTIKTPEITFKNLITSGRQIGHDIMGTMINVLLFTYVCGLMPLIIIKLKNEISLFTIIKLQIPFEICRFLFGSIQILLAIPVSIAISGLFLLKRRKKS